MHGLTIAAIFIGSIALFVGGIAAISLLVSHIAWVRDGKPIFIKEEQLQIDLWRSTGMSVITARRKVLALRHSPFRVAIEEIRESQGVLTHLARQEE